MQNYTTSWYLRYECRAKTPVDIEVRNNGIYSLNGNLNKPRESKSRIRRSKYYSLDVRHFMSKTDITTNERQSIVRSKIDEKLDKKHNEISIFGKRESELESSIC